MKLRRRFRNSAPTILSLLSGVGVVGTIIVTWIQTPKIQKKLDEAKKERLDKVETVLKVAPDLAPIVGIAGGTILCIAGANGLNRRNQASMLGALAVTERAWREHRNKVTEIYGEDANQKIDALVAKDHLDKSDIPEGEEKLFYEPVSCAYFRGNDFRVLSAEYRANRDFSIGGYVTFNRFLAFLGVDEINGGDEIGWDAGALWDNYEAQWIDFDHYNITTDDGIECCMIEYPFWPSKLDE